MRSKRRMPWRKLMRWTVRGAAVLVALVLAVGAVRVWWVNAAGDEAVRRAERRLERAEIPMSWEAIRREMPALETGLPSEEEVDALFDRAYDEEASEAEREAADRALEELNYQDSRQEVALRKLKAAVALAKLPVAGEAKLPYVGGGEGPARGESIEPELADLVAEAVASRRRVYELTEEALALEPFQSEYHREQSLGDLRETAFHGAMNFLRDWYRLKALHHRARGEAGPALEAGVTMLRLAHAFRREQWGRMPHILRVNVMHGAMETIEAALARHEYEAAALEPIIELLRELERSLEPLEALRQEIAVNAWKLRNPDLLLAKNLRGTLAAGPRLAKDAASATVGVDGSAGDMGKMYMRAVLLGDPSEADAEAIERRLRGAARWRMLMHGVEPGALERVIADRMAQRLDAYLALRDGTGPAPAQWLARREERRRSREEEREREWWGQFYNFYCKIGQPGEAFRRIMIAGLRAERYRLRHSRWPRSMTELAGEDPLPEELIDPMDGTALRITSDDRGVTVFSIGENRINDGGRSPSTWSNPGGEHPPDDPNFRLFEREFREGDSPGGSDPDR